MDITIFLPFVFILIIFFLYKKNKEGIKNEAIIAFIISLIWVWKYGYIYKTNNLIIFGINLFPLFAWTLGLILLREVYEKLKGKRFLKATLIYWIALISLEWFGYAILNIQLDSNFPGLLGFNVMHGTDTLQLVYILLGPAYLFITDFFKVK